MARILVTDDETFNLIRHNLGDRYKSGFPVLKELIQNAEDAEASHLRFVFHPGWLEAAHPLLRHSGMIVVNDGKFRMEHGKKMLSFANSSKAGEVGAIGRFGFGQKAVFHLCDAFIIHAFGHEDAFDEVANPCAGLSSASDNQAIHWDKAPGPKDLDRMRSAAAVDFAQGVLLWLPFRHRGLLPAPGLSFTAEEPHATQLAAEIRDNRDQLALILAASRNLCRIEVKNENEPILDLSLSPKASRPAKVDHTEAAARTFGGELRLPEKRRYYAVEQRHLTPELEAIKGEQDWPTSMGFKDGVYTKIPDKAEPHAAIILVEGEASDTPVLRMEWGVFLPLRDSGSTIAPACEIALPKGCPSLHLLLHGYFFVDSGRRYVQGFDAGGVTGRPKLVERWNRTLCDQLLLPLLPRVFFEAQSAGLMGDFGLAAVLKALRQSDFWRDHRAAIVADIGLGQVARKRSEGRIVAEWAPLPVKGPRFAPVPAPDDRGDLNLAEVLPHSVDVAESRGLLLLSAPLGALTPEEPKWREDDLRAVLALPASIFRRGRAFSALLSLLTEILRDAPHLVAAASGPVLTALRSAMAGEAAMPENDDMRALFRLIQTKDCFALPGGDDYSRRILASLAQAELGPVAVRGTWLGDGPRRQWLELPEAERLLRAIAPWMEGTADEDGRLEEEANATALEVLALLKSRIRQALASPTFASLTVLRLADQNGQKRPVTLLDLRRASEEKRLFIGSPSTNRRLPLLARALPRSQFLILRGERAMAVLRDDAFEDDLVFCQPDNAVIARLVREATVWGDEEDRIALMKEIGLSDLQYRSALRILATGRQEAARDTVTLHGLFRQAQGLDGLFQRLLSHIDDVIVVSFAVEEAFGAKDLSVLHIKELDAEQLGEHLLRHADKFQRIAPTRQEIEALFRSPISPEILADLPIFADAEGGFCSARMLVREAGSVLVPDGLRKLVRFADRRWVADMGIRYSNCIQAWSPLLQIETALGAPNPAQHAHDILEAVKHWPEDVLPQGLAQVAWLADTDGKGHRAVDVLDLPDNISSLAAPLLDAGRFLRSSALAKGIGEHPALARLRERGILSDRVGSLHRLLDLVTERKPIALLPGMGDLPLNALRRLAELGIQLDLPGWPLFSALLQLPSDASGLGADPSRAFAEISFDQIDGVRKALKRIATKAESSEAAAPAVEVFAYVFTGLFRQSEARRQDILRGVPVPTKAGCWVSADQVAAAASGVVTSALLHDDLARHEHVAEGRGTDQVETEDKSIAVDPAKRTAHARDFCDALRKGVPVQLLFLFCALIGIDPKEMGLAQTGEGASADEVRDEVHAALQRYAASLNMGTYETFLSRNHFLVQRAPVGHVLCRSLTGEIVELAQAQDGHNLLRGNGHQRPIKYGHQLLIVLTYDGAIHEQNYAGDLIEGLAEALPVIVREAIRTGYQYYSAIEPLIAKARNVDQMTAKATEKMLIDGLIRTVEQLKPQNGGQVDKALREAQTRQGELARGADNPVAMDKVNRGLFAALQGEGATAELLQAMRGKIAEYGYSPKRIFFELFQNADDATVQKRAKSGAFRLDDRRSEGFIDVIHWGRPINDFSLDPAQGRIRKYDRDLLNMLQINASAKEQKDGVSGHFGLGFKSIHLLSRSVYLASGLSVATRISGGFLPGRWDQGRAEVRNFAKNDAPATLVRLDLDPQMKAQTQTAVETFRRAARVLPALARGIRQIVLDGEVFESKAALEETENFRVISVTSAEKLRMLRIRLDEKSTLLIRLDDTGPVPFGDGLAGLWSLAPLEERLHSGWILDIRDLPLDPGRTRLKETPEESEARFANLGGILATRLLELYDLAKGRWADFSGLLNLAHAGDEIGRLAFWRKMVRLFEADLNHQITGYLHDRHRGIGPLLAERAVLASGLTGAFGQCVVGQDVAWQVVGELARTEVQESVAYWEGVSDRSGKVVSTEVAQLLMRLGVAQPQKLRLERLLADVLTVDPDVTPARAQTLGRALNAEALKAVRETEEQKALQALIGTARFQMEDGIFRRAYLSARENPREGSDEVHLLAFAPSAVVAASSYGQGAAADFYALAANTSGSTRNSDTYFKWLTSAETAAKREGGLRYLIDGDLGNDVGEKLRRVLPEWIGRDYHGLNNHALLVHWKSGEKTRLAQLLFPVQTDLFRPAAIPPNPAPLDAFGLLDAVHRWWDKGGAAEAQRHDHRHSPSGLPLDFKIA